MTEDTPANAPTPAQQVFLETEEKLKALETGTLKVCNYRTGTIYGPGREHVNEPGTSPASRFPFDGQSDAMLIHRDDVVRGIEFAIEHRLSGLYNLFNDIPENKQDFARVRSAGLEPVTRLGVVRGPRRLQREDPRDRLHLRRSDGRAGGRRAGVTA